MLAARGLARDVVLRVASVQAAIAAVEQTDVLLTAPSRVVSGIVERCDHFCELPLPLPIAPCRIRALWHRRFDDDAAHRWLREAVSRAADAYQRAHIGGPAATSHASPPRLWQSPTPS